MKVECYEMLPDINCYNIIGNIDMFQLDNTEDKMIMIDVKRKIAKKKGRIIIWLAYMILKYIQKMAFI